MCLRSVRMTQRERSFDFAQDDRVAGPSTSLRTTEEGDPCTLQSRETSFHTKALSAAPASGATMKSQSCRSAVPPSKMAGPMLLAGLTEVPVIGMQTICISTKVRPIARPASIFPAHSSAEENPEGDGRIDMAAGDTSDGVSHCHHCKSESKSDPECTDSCADCAGHATCKDCASATQSV